MLDILNLVMRSTLRHFTGTHQVKIKYQEGNLAAKYMYHKLKFGLKRHEIFWLADYFYDLVPRISKKLRETPESNPLHDELKKLLLDSIEQMDKYRQLQREL
ncbi:Uncharacterised protein [Klebsiella pneumoniae]|uniref:hypothetical protein n=1 Tax=Klebsiella pneumoniae TaxID=573 RepID=UPI000E03D894|nr:hypothetical protein [Klebsiella pneumoniae]STV34166.1 Uncharacterised protein [Klebsiella pneumoniae]